MPVRSLLRPLLALLAIAAATWLVALHALPLFVMRVATSRIRSGAVAEARAAAGTDAAASGSPATGPANHRRMDPELAARVLERDGWNVAIPAPPTTSDSRTIVRPSPDLLYAACVYDLSAGPLLVRAPHAPTYLSLSAFAENTDNYFAANDRGPDGTEGLSLLLVPPGDSSPAPAGAAGATRVESPSLRGIVLARFRVDHPDRLPELVALQRRVTCDPVR